MFPNPQDALPLPAAPAATRARLEEEASALLAANGAGEASLREGAEAWNDVAWGDAAWTGAAWIGAAGGAPRAGGDEHESVRDHERRRRRRIDTIARYAQHRLTSEGGDVACARDILARIHGFATWEAIAAHVDAVVASLDGTAGDGDAASAIARFERAADAIVSGDLVTLERLLLRDPALVHARSTRTHRATLLHYVSANGVENWRQRTPPNIVAVAQALLDAGADVRADADVYGGGALTLGLVVTSAHPRAAGVQLALTDLLLARGAPMEPHLVHWAVMNGCPEAAAHLAALGAEVQLPDAAAIARVDLVRAHFEPTRTASERDAALALIGATWYNAQAVVAYLLRRGLAVDTRHPDDGETALHVAAYLGHVQLVEALLALGAPVNVSDQKWGTPPLVWALHAWLEEGKGPAESYRRIVDRLVDRGAIATREWSDDPRLRDDVGLWRVLGPDSRPH